MTDTMQALLAAIRAHPDEDTPRLAFADAAIEAAGTVKCAACGGLEKRKRGYCNAFMYGCDEFGDNDCSHKNEMITCGGCKESGRVSDGRAELAAFVRVQVELAAEHSDCGAKGYGPCGERCEELRRRERELWPAVRGRFEGDEWTLRLGIEDGNRWTPEMVNNANFGLSIPTDATIDSVDVRDGVPIVTYTTHFTTATVHVRRGFPAVVRCTLDQWRGGECERCGGAGEYATGCGSCVDGRTPGIGPRLAQQWPILTVEVTDAGEQNLVYKEGRDWLVELPWEDVRDHYDSESAARAALSAALIAEARGQSVDGA